MNEKDLMLYEQIKGELGDPPQSGPVVIDVKTTQFVRLELVLLKALIGDGRPGLFISVDRPHQYMVHLLTMHQIEHCNITFVDAVSRFSADRKQAKANVGFLRGPRNIDTLPEALKEWSSEDNDQNFDLNECKFAMIDNPAILLNFNTHQVVYSFLEEFVECMGNKVSIPLVVDRERNPNLFQMATSISKSELHMGVISGDHPSDRPRLKIVEKIDNGGMC
jgi:hypothetical protein